jgi:transposase InsO family protein
MMRERVFEYIEVFYNRKRKHSALGYLSPTQYLSQWAEKAVAGELAA